MNVIARLEYELAYYDSAVHRFNHYTTRIPPSNYCIWRHIRYNFFYFFTKNISQLGCPRGVMVQALDCGIVIREYLWIWLYEKLILIFFFFFFFRKSDLLDQVSVRRPPTAGREGTAGDVLKWEETRFPLSNLRSPSDKYSLERYESPLSSSTTIILPKR